MYTYYTEIFHAFDIFHVMSHNFKFHKIFKHHKSNRIYLMCISSITPYCLNVVF